VSIPVIEESVETSTSVGSVSEGFATHAVPAAGVLMLPSLLAIHALIDLFSGVWPIFKHLAGISLESAGLIATIAPLLTWSLQPLFGMWADRGHMRTCILWGVALSFPMMLLGPISNATGEYTPAVYLLMFVIVLLSRLGQAIFHPAAAAMAGDLARGTGRSGMVAFFVACGWAGFGINQIVFTKTFHATGGHTEWLLLPGGLLLCWAIVSCRPREHNAARTHRYRDALRSLHLVRDGMLPLFISLSAISCVEQGFMFLLPEFCESRGMPVWYVQGGALMCFVAGTVTFMVAAGFLADRIGRKLVLNATLLLSLVVYTAMILSGGLALGPMMALMFLAGGMINTAGPLGVAIAQHLLLEHRSMVTGIMMGLTWTVGGIAPFAMGLLAPRMGVQGALLTLVACNAVAIVAALSIPREREATV